MDGDDFGGSYELQGKTDTRKIEIFGTIDKSNPHSPDLNTGTRWSKKSVRISDEDYDDDGKGHNFIQEERSTKVYAMDNEDQNAMWPEPKFGGGQHVEYLRVPDGMEMRSCTSYNHYL